MGRIKISGEVVNNIKDRISMICSTSRLCFGYSKLTFHNASNWHNAKIKSRRSEIFYVDDIWFTFDKWWYVNGHGNLTDSLIGVGKFDIVFDGGYVFEVQIFSSKLFDKSRK